MAFTAEQLAERWGVGASVVGALMGVNPYETRDEAIAKLCGDAEPFAGNDDTDMGDAMEPLLARWFTRATGVQLVKGETVRHPTIPWAYATPDYLATDGSQLVELKNKRFRKKVNDQIDTFRCQVMWQMACRNVDRGAVFIHYMAISTAKPERFETIEVVRDQRLEGALIREITNIWETIIVPARVAKGMRIAA